MNDSFTDRRLIFSTADLQAQLIECCCEPGTFADLSASVSIENVGLPASSIAILESTITVANNGPSTAKNVALTSSLSADGAILNAISFETTQGQWLNTQFQAGADNAQFAASIGNLAASGIAILSFTTEVVGPVTHSIEVTSLTSDPDSTNNSDSATFPPTAPDGPQ